MQQHIDVGHHVRAVGEQAGNGRGRSHDFRQLAVLALEGRAVGVAATELDDRSPGNACQRQLGLGIDLDRGVGRQTNARQYPARVLVVQAQFDHVADLDAVVLHRAAFGQAADGFVEHHFVILERAVHARLGQPQAKQHGPDDNQDAEQADQYMMGTGFHVIAP